jgi:hypothetical protein
LTMEAARRRVVGFVFPLIVTLVRKNHNRNAQKPGRGRSQLLCCWDRVLSEKFRERLDLIGGSEECSPGQITPALLRKYFIFNATEKARVSTRE